MANGKNIWKATVSLPADSSSVNPCSNTRFAVDLLDQGIPTCHPTVGMIIHTLDLVGPAPPELVAPEARKRARKTGARKGTPKKSPKKAAKRRR